MKKVINCINFLLLIALFACNENSSIDDTVKNLYGKRIEIDWDGMIASPPDSVKFDYEKRPFKVVAKFENEVCAPCFLGHLEACTKLMELFPEDSVAYICIVPAEEKEIMTRIESNDYSNLCIISDVDDKYSSKNRIKGYRSFFQTYLLDRRNRIVIVGDPLRNNKIRELYLEKVGGSSIQSSPKYD